MPASELSMVLHIPESRITVAHLFQNGNEIHKLPSSRYLAFMLPPNASSTIYYLRVDCFLEARIPIEIKAIDRYYSGELTAYIFIGLYAGIVISILLFNLLSFFSFGNKTYLHYMFMVIGIATNAFYKDGLFALLLGPTGINQYLELTINSIVAITSVFFTKSYLGLNNEYLLIRRLGITAIVIGHLLNVTHIISDNFLAYVFSNVFFLLALDFFWLTSILIWKKSFEAKLFSLAFGLPLFFAHGYYINPHFGIEFLNLPLAFYKVISVFEMIIFTYAIMYQAKKLRKEKKEFRRRTQDYTDQLESNHKGLNSRKATVIELIETYGFTLREIEVLKKVAEDKSNKEIAEQLFVSQNTVKFHIRNIFHKLNVKSRKDASHKYLNF